MELVAHDVVDAALSTLQWRRENDELTKSVRRQDFREALAYVNEVGRLAEQMGHHPDIEIRWNTVSLRLSTHSMGGLTDADLTLAREIDALDR